MATLELSLEEDVTAAAAPRARRLGPLFWMAIGWMTFVFAVAILADVLPLPSPTGMDMLERRGARSFSPLLGSHRARGGPTFPAGFCGPGLLVGGVFSPAHRPPV